jgi:hypothetical protein
MRDFHIGNQSVFPGVMVYVAIEETGAFSKPLVVQNHLPSSGQRDL